MKTKLFILLIFLYTILFLMTGCQQLFQANDSNDTYSYGDRKLGINLFAVQEDYCKDRFFADAMKTSRKWKEPGNYGNGEDVDIDSNGWPTVDAGIVVWAGIDQMNGTYYIEGEAGSEPTISLGYMGGTLTNWSWDSENLKFSGNIVVNSTSTTGLLITFRDTTDGVRNVKLMKPVEPGSSSYYSTDCLFTDSIKKMVEDFSVIRFMFAIDGWNGPWQEEWSERVPPDYASMNRNMGIQYDRGDWAYVGWAGTGMAWEYAIEFCNETGKDMWINMPIAASDNYIYQLAQLIKDNYTVPDGKVYWEYSNEATWDLQQRCSSYLLTMSQEEAASDDVIDYDGSTDINVLRNRYYAMRSVEMSQIWRNVWGDSNMMTRIRPIHSGHLIYDSQSITGLMFVDNWYNNGDGNNVADPHPVSYFFYGTGGSHYTGDNPDEYKEDGYSEIEVFEKYEEEEACLAKMYGIKRVAYEGGVWTSADEYLLPRITDAMIRYQQLWDKYDNDLLMHYVTTGGEDNGTALGFTMDSLDLSTRKFEALSELLYLKKKDPGAGILAPGTIEGADWSCTNYASDHPEPAGLETAGSAELNGQYYKYRGYLFRVDESRSYSFSITCNDTSSAEIELIVDGNVIADTIVSGSQSDVFSKTLSPGLHGIRVRKKNTGYFLLKQIVIE